MRRRLQGAPCWRRPRAAACRSAGSWCLRGVGWAQERRRLTLPCAAAVPPQHTKQARHGRSAAAGAAAYQWWTRSRCRRGRPAWRQGPAHPAAQTAGRDASALHWGWGWTGQGEDGHTWCGRSHHHAAASGGGGEGAATHPTHLIDTVDHHGTAGHLTDEPHNLVLQQGRGKDHGGRAGGAGVHAVMLQGMQRPRQTLHGSACTAPGHPPAVHSCCPWRSP